MRPSPPGTGPQIDAGPGGVAKEPPAQVTVATANPADSKVVAQVAAGVTGNGIVEQASRGLAARSAAPIRCGFNAFNCYTRVQPGQRVTLRARPLRGYQFRTWTGPCAGQGASCVIVARALETVTALFTPRNPAAAVGLEVRPMQIHIRWRRSIGSGSIIVSGRIGGPARSLRAPRRRTRSS